MSWLKTAHNRPSSVVSSGEAELLAYDRLEHLVHRRTGPGGEPVLPLENEGGQFVPVIQLGRRVAREPGGFGEQVLGDHG